MGSTSVEAYRPGVGAASRSRLGVTEAILVWGMLCVPLDGSDGMYVDTCGESWAERVRSSIGAGRLLRAIAGALIATVAAVGCGADAGGGSGGDGKLTYYEDIAPIVQDNCLGCHRSGGIAPFSLASYEDVVKVAPVMKAAVKSRRMPPWMPGDDCTPLADARRLTDSEIETIVGWIDGDRAPGDPADGPNAKPNDAGALARVDRTLKIPGSYTPKKGKGGTADDYHCFVVDPKLTRDETLVGFELKPGAATMVHHVIVFEANMAKARAREDAPGQGYTCYGGPRVSGAKMVGGWVPGSRATRLPQGTGISLTKGKALVIQVHYSFANIARGKVETDSSTELRLEFSDKPVKTSLLFYPLAQTKFSIPPGSKDYDVTASMTLPLAGRLWGVVPHMHQQGSEIRVDLERGGPDDKVCLVDVPAWDFDWQQIYFYKAESGLPFGLADTVKMRCTFDNDTDRTLTWGESTDDEMCLTYFLVSLGP